MSSPYNQPDHDDIVGLVYLQKITKMSINKVIVLTHPGIKGIKREMESTEGTEQSSTAVLATLAALAEATGPLNANSSSSKYVDCL